MIRALVFAGLFAACAPRAMPLTPDHPASPDAQPGRSAGAPAALRPGVATLDDPAPAPSEATPPVDHSQHGGAPAASPEPTPKVDTIEDTAKEPKRVDPEKADPQKPKPKTPKKPPKKPAEPAKPPPKPPEPPMDHSGHGGHPS